MDLQIRIEHACPNAELKYKWRIPWYYLNGSPICYLNQSKDYIDDGFWHSAHLTKYTEYTVSEKRKVVKSMRYKTLEVINDDLWIRILKEVGQHKHKSFLK